MDSVSYAPLDSSFKASFEIIGGKIVGQTLRLAQNHITINRGADDGVTEGMGIFTQNGAVGRIKEVSKKLLRRYIPPKYRALGLFQNQIKRCLRIYQLGWKRYSGGQNALCT